MALKSSHLLPALTACAAAIMLAGCETDRPVARGLQPLSPQMLTQLEREHMPIDSRILHRETRADEPQLTRIPVFRHWLSERVRPRIWQNRRKHNDAWRLLLGRLLRRDR